MTDNLYIYSCKNPETSMYWLSLYKNDTFIDFVTYGTGEIGIPCVSPCGNFIAYYQYEDIVDNKDTHRKLILSFWKYNADLQELQPYNTICVDADISLDINSAQICFNYQSTYALCLTEWNHIYLINLKKFIAPVEFYIPNGCNRILPQYIYTSMENYFIWFGQDENVRIIDLNGDTPIMWSDKILIADKYYNEKTKYFFEFNGYIIYMHSSGTVLISKVNLETKSIRPNYEFNYPISCADIKIIDSRSLCFQTIEKKRNTLKDTIITF